MISFGGEGSSFGVVKQSGGGAGNSRESMADKLRAFARRFDRVAVENLDWQRCLELYDKPETFFFIDPPYMGGKQKAYKSWSMEEFQTLRTSLSKLKGRWLLTCNDSKELRSLFKGCSIQAVDRAKGIGAANKNVDRYQELIIKP